MEIVEVLVLAQDGHQATGLIKARASKCITPGCNRPAAQADADQAIPNKSSFTRARQRLGPAVLEAVFRKLARAGGPGRAGGRVLAGDAGGRGRRVHP